jgi:SOS-response transcriptional repressor LexA
MHLGERLRALIDGKNLAHRWVAEEVGITAAALSRILDGTTRDPSFFTIYAIAVAIKEPISAIVGDSPFIWSTEDLDQLSEHGEWIVERTKGRQVVSPLPIPERRRAGGKVTKVIPVAASHRSGLEPSAFEQPNKRIPREMKDRGANGVFQVVGESMTGAGYEDGDLVYVRPNREPQSAVGKVVVCLVDGTPLIKHLRTRGRKLLLESAHPDHPPMPINEDSERFKLIGIVIGKSR